jgi:SAM-dependent methyltransferase
MAHIWQTHLGSDVPYDARYHDNTRTEMVSFIDEAPTLVLDIGCGGGATGKLIKEKFPGTRVLGIEKNPHAAERARDVLDEVLCDDLDSAQVIPYRERIDLVLILDVLEHLYDPWRSLLRIREWLRPGTRVLASLPNVRNLITLDDLASGQWPYDVNGVLDITHLRFFTKLSLRALFEETGYEVVAMHPLLQRERIERRVVLRRPGELKTRSLSINFHDLEDLEDLYALQYVIDARVLDSARAAAPEPGDDEDLRDSSRHGNRLP